jgi:uncharacterized protein (UPF0216 family)
VADDRPLEKWFALEMGKLRDGIVTAPCSVSDLLLEDAPSVATRGGAPFVFDKAVLARVGAALSPLERRRLRLPVTFFVDSEMPEDAYLADETAVALLRALGEAPTLASREGKAWVGHARARDIAARFPTVFQFVVL